MSFAVWCLLFVVLFLVISDLLLLSLRYFPRSTLDILEAWLFKVGISRWSFKIRSYVALRRTSRFLHVFSTWDGNEAACVLGFRFPRIRSSHSLWGSLYGDTLDMDYARWGNVRNPEMVLEPRYPFSVVHSTGGFTSTFRDLIPFEPPLRHNFRVHFGFWSGKADQNVFHLLEISFPQRYYAGGSCYAYQEPPFTVYPYYICTVRCAHALAPWTTGSYIVSAPNLLIFASFLWLIHTQFLRVCNVEV